MDNKTKVFSAFRLLLPLLEQPGSFSQSMPAGAWIQGDLVSSELLSYPHRDEEVKVNEGGKY